MRRNDRTQVLLNVTGSGEDFHHDPLIEQTQRPALILGAEQDAGGAALWRSSISFPTTPVRLFVSYYRLLPAGKRISRAPTPISRRFLGSTSKSTACTTPRRGRCSNCGWRSSSSPRLSLHLRFIGSVRDLFDHDLHHPPQLARSNQRQLLADLVTLPILAHRSGNSIARLVPVARRRISRFFRRTSQDRAPGGRSLFGNEVRIDPRFPIAHRTKTDGLQLRHNLRQFATTDAAADAYCRRFPASRSSCASGSSSSTPPTRRSKRSDSRQRTLLRPRNDGGSRRLRRHRSTIHISPLQTRRKPPPALFQICARQRAAVRRRKPRPPLRSSAACFAATSGTRRRSPSRLRAARRCMANRPRLRFEEMERHAGAGNLRVGGCRGGGRSANPDGVFARAGNPPNRLARSARSTSRPARTQVGNLVRRSAASGAAGLSRLVHRACPSAMAEELTGKYLHEQETSGCASCIPTSTPSSASEIIRESATRRLRAAPDWHQSAAQRPRHFGLALGRHILNADKEGVAQRGQPGCEPSTAPRATSTTRVILYADAVHRLHAGHHAGERLRRREKQEDLQHRQRHLRRRSVRTKDIGDILNGVYEHDTLLRRRPTPAGPTNSRTPPPSALVFQAFDRRSRKTACRTAAADLDFEEAAWLCNGKSNACCARPNSPSPTTRPPNSYHSRYGGRVPRRNARSAKADGGGDRTRAREQNLQACARRNGHRACPTKSRCIAPTPDKRNSAAQTESRRNGAGR